MNRNKHANTRAWAAGEQNFRVLLVQGQLLLVGGSTDVLAEFWFGEPVFYILSLYQVLSIICTIVCAGIIMAPNCNF